MGKSIVFDLGLPIDLTSRTVLIQNIGVQPPTTIYSGVLGGDVETVTVDIDDNRRCQLTLTDLRDSNTGVPTVFGFNTNSNSLKFESGQVRILSWEDTSSSSSTSSLSSSSSSSSSTNSSSSSSSSTSSASSQSSSSSSSSSTS